MVSLKQAEAYYNLGWAVIPFGDFSWNEEKKKWNKRPLINEWKHFQTEKMLPWELQEYFGDGTEGIGLVTGAISGVTVVDVDSYHSEEKIDIDSPMVCKTISGGKHYYFKYKDIGGDKTGVKGFIDIRSGGLIVLPPSGVDGHYYEWEKNCSISDLPELPESILKLIDDKPKERTDFVNSFGKDSYRNQTLYETAFSYLLNKPQNRSETEWIETTWNMMLTTNETYNPPKPESEMKTIFNSVVKGVRERWQKIKAETDEPITNSSWISFPQLLENSEKELLATDSNSIVEYGYHFLDDKLGGIFPGEMVLVGGITGTGKTTFITRVARNIAVKHKVGMIIAEDRLNDYGVKCLYFEIGKIRTGNNYPWIAFRKNEIVSPSLKEELSTAKKNLNLSNMSFLQLGGLPTIDLIEATIEKHHRETGTKIFFLDHLHMMSIDAKYSKEAQYEEVMKRLTTLKDRLEISLVVVAHFRKTDEKKVPTLTDFKDAMAIAQNSNTVIILWRDRTPEALDKYDERATKFIIPKARMGLTEFTATVNFSKESGEYEEQSVEGGVFGEPSSQETFIY